MYFWTMFWIIKKCIFNTSVLIHLDSYTDWTIYVLLDNILNYQEMYFAEICLQLIAYVTMSMCSKFHVYSCSRSWDIVVFLSTYYHSFYSPFFLFFFFFNDSWKLPILVFRWTHAVLQNRSNLSWKTCNSRLTTTDRG